MTSLCWATRPSFQTPLSSCVILLKIILLYGMGKRSFASIRRGFLGCGLCVSLCPTKNLSLRDGKATAEDRCTMCYRCISRCPQKAITLLGDEVIEQCRFEKYGSEEWKCMRAESGLWIEKLGCRCVFGWGQWKAGVFAISRDEWLTGKSKFARIWKWSIEHYPWMKQNNSGVWWTNWITIWQG